MVGIHSSVNLSLAGSGEKKEKKETGIRTSDKLDPPASIKSGGPPDPARLHPSQNQSNQSLSPKASQDLTTKKRVRRHFEKKTTSIKRQNGWLLLQLRFCLPVPFGLVHLQIG
ncbi:hypothetical protein VTN31DRAFT_467 [Thermomyces dupontii]|uniref:uncharacterized protein n=1 Tax=Talaromyces thermophilus TaxID=28565 RepID=UPI0037420AA0